jgi:polysaccharide chain length determinant protein (PEP-CTERM system associated)
MNDYYELTFSDYLGIVRRRWLYLLIPFLLVFLAAVGIALWLPPVYKSTGTILIESQQIPDELIRSTVTSYADERIQVIQQLVMTRDNLLRIIKKYNLFPKIRDDLTVSEQIDLMRENIEVERVAEDNSRDRNRTTIAFTLSFQDNSPEMAHAVANELVTLFLEENVKTRTERASETTEFLTQEATRLKRDLELIEERMATYKQENSEALPEHLDLHMKMLERTESAIEEVERNIKSAKDDYRFLEIELSAIKAGVANSPGQTVPTTPEQALTMAEAELMNLQSRYSDSHPDIKRQRKQIEELKAQLAETPADGQAGSLEATGQSIDVSRVRARMASMSDQIGSLEKQLTRLKEERGNLEKIIIQTPQVERALTSLNRDYENTLNKYQEIQNKEMGARLAESLEQGKKAERFSLLEPPIRPEKPIEPNRIKIMAMGFFLALAAAVGLVFMIETMDKRVFGSDALTHLLTERPLAVIPYMTTQEEAAQRKRLKRWTITGGLCAGILIAIGIHNFYMPLDLIAIKVMARLG